MQKYQATVESVVYLERDIAVITFSSDLDSYQAGQYITIFIPGSSTPEGKAYSLASSPEDKNLIISIRKMGEYSTFLYNLKPGDTFSHSKGYGHFNPNTSQPLVCFAGGVGISPIWSVIKNTLASSPDQPITLAYSTKTTGDASFLPEITKARHNSALSLFHHQTKNPAAELPERIDPTDYIQADAYYLLCGSVGFTKSLWQSLSKAGISHNNIYTEVFFE